MPREVSPGQNRIQGPCRERDVVSWWQFNSRCHLFAGFVRAAILHVSKFFQLSRLWGHLWPHLGALTPKWRNFARSVYCQFLSRVYCPAHGQCSEVRARVTDDRSCHNSHSPLWLLAQREPAPQSASHHWLKLRVGLAESHVIITVIFPFCCVRNSGC